MTWAPPLAYILSPNRGSVTNPDARRPITRGIFIHATRSGQRYWGLQEEYEHTRAYFSRPGGTSAHALVGPFEVTLCLERWMVAWHAEENNWTHWSIEVAQPRPDLPFNDFQVRATAWLCRQAQGMYPHIPLVRVFSQNAMGIIGHEDSEQGKRHGKIDPGRLWPWDEFMRQVRGEEDDMPNPALIAKLDEALSLLRGNLVGVLNALYDEPLTVRMVFDPEARRAREADWTYRWKGLDQQYVAAVAAVHEARRLAG